MYSCAVVVVCVYVQLCSGGDYAGVCSRRDVYKHMFLVYMYGMFLLLPMLAVVCKLTFKTSFPVDVDRGGDGAAVAAAANRFKRHAHVETMKDGMESAVRCGRITPGMAAHNMLDAFFGTTRVSSPAADTGEGDDQAGR